MRDFNTYPQHFAPQVCKPKSSTTTTTAFKLRCAFRQRPLITVVMDSTYNVDFGRLDPPRLQHLAEHANQPKLPLSAGPRSGPSTQAKEHGFLWRLNTY